MDNNVISKEEGYFCAKCNSELAGGPGFWLKNCQSCGVRTPWKPPFNEENLLSETQRFMEGYFNGSCFDLLNFMNTQNVLTADEKARLKEFIEKM